MKFTKEEVSLCKQVAERYRREIKYGDWFYDVSLEESENPLSLHLKELFNIPADEPGETIIPLWTISDCLKFLKEKDVFRSLHQGVDDKFEVVLILEDGNHYFIGKTPLEACLKAALAVVEEK